MDKLILGLLMIKHFTVYEIRQIIRQNFTSICSDSLGSIQAALKKLSQQEAVTFSEYVEKGKKCYMKLSLDFGLSTLFQILSYPRWTAVIFRLAKNSY